MEFSWLTACCLRKGGADACCTSSQGTWRKRRQRSDALSAKAVGSFARVRIGRSKGCARASWSWLQKSAGGLRLREACSDPSPEGAACVDGGLASSRKRARKRRAAGSREEVPSAGSSRKASRDRTETVTTRARVRVSPADGRHFGSRSWLPRHGGVSKAILAASGSVDHARAWQRDQGKRQGCQRFGLLEAQGRQRLA
jgi:hypothetical protein